jgi:plastocyanin
MRPWHRSIAAVAVIGGLTACGGDDAGDDGARPASEATATATAASDERSGSPVVDMTDSLQFEPREIKVSVGDRVQWRNVGQIAHTVTTDPSRVSDQDGVSVPSGVKPWDSGLLGGDETFSRTFRKPGTYQYICIPHEGAGMIGTVVVES